MAPSALEASDAAAWLATHIIWSKLGEARAGIMLQGRRPAPRAAGSLVRERDGATRGNQARKNSVRVRGGAQLLP